MNRKDVAVVAVVAVATAAVALGMARTGRLIAADSSQRDIAAPVLKHGAMDITLRGSKSGSAAELEAVNPGPTTETFHGTLTERCRTPESMMNRRMVLPIETWRQDIIITLSPGERKSLTFAPDHTASVAAARLPVIAIQPIQAKTAVLPAVTQFQLSDGKSSVATPWQAPQMTAVKPAAVSGATTGAVASQQALQPG